MSDVAKTVRERIEELEKLSEKCRKALNSTSPGNLRINKVRDKTYYYLINGGSDGKPVYISKNDEELIRKMAQTDYWLAVQKAVDQELAYLKKMGERYPGQMAEKVYDSLDENRKTLVRPFNLPDEEYARRWLAVPYEGKSFRDGDRFFHTLNNEQVRSKSEVIIANTLRSEGIPYRYECPVILNDGSRVFPDFTALNLRESKTRIWEHMGMMDDPDYRGHALERIRRYGENGIFPGTEMILTFETTDHPLDTREVRRVIRHYLQ